MNRVIHCMVLLFVRLVVCCCSAFNVTANDSTDVSHDEPHYVLSAYPVGNVSVRGSVGLALTLLPQPLTEYPTPAPMVDIRSKLTFPLGINGTLRLASNLATSLAQGGGFWATNFGSLSVGAGYSVAFIYGNITYVDGFRTTQQRWINYPMVIASWSFPKATLSAKLEAEYTTSVTSTIDGQPTKNNHNQVTGSVLTVAIEQPFFKLTHVVLGVSFQYSSDPYQAWFLYSAFSDRLFSSEFFMGFIL